MRWGLVATVRADLTEILNFVAFHAELGAHRIYIYLDQPDPAAYGYLKAHSKVRVTVCDEAYWARHPRRPKKHQVRQTVNATHAYSRAELDWIAHIDVDEFLWTRSPIADQLAALPKGAQCAKIPPAEVLAGDGTAFKTLHPWREDRVASVERLYPKYGTYLDSGFLSHVGGKVFARTQLQGITLRIHNMYQNGEKSALQSLLQDTILCHCHAPSWEAFIGAYRFRLEQGSYRADLAPMRDLMQGGLTRNELFRYIEKTEGIEGIRAFFDEVVADTADHRERLEQEGLLLLCDLKLDQARAKHFPDFA